MRVTLVHAEIQAAVVAMLAKRGINTEDQDIAVAFSMGRKNTGLSATVDIVDPSVVQLPDAVVEEDDDVTAVATSTPAAKAETKEVKNAFVAKTDESGTIAVSSEPEEVAMATTTTTESPPFEVDEDASSDAPTTSPAASEEAPKKTTQSLFAN